MKLAVVAVLSLVLVASAQVVVDDNENVEKDPILNYGILANPFRMQKINLMWEKARKNLQENKLKLLYSELKMQVRRPWPFSRFDNAIFYFLYQKYFQFCRTRRS